MHSSRNGKSQLEVARDEVARRGVRITELEHAAIAETARLASARAEMATCAARIAAMERAHMLLEHLYDVSKLLTRFQSVEGTLPYVIGLIAQTLSLRSAIFITETAGAARTIVWQARGESPFRLRAAKAHAQTAYRYLVGSGVDLERDPDITLDLPPGSHVAGRTKGEGRLNFVLLPLVVGHGSIFGALQVESTGPLEEADLVCVNAVVNQLAIAVDRQAIIDARQATAEAGEKEQRLLADLSALTASSLEHEDLLGQVAQFVVPVLADLCVIEAIGGDGALQSVVRFADEQKQLDLAEHIRRFSPRPGSQTPRARTLAFGESFLFSRITNPLAEGIAEDERHEAALRAAGVHSMLVVPLRARGRIFGTLTFAAAESGRRYSTHDLALAEQSAHRAAIAIDNGRLYRQAQAATRARDNLLATVSHDLNNPLSVILTSLALMSRPPGPDERRKVDRQVEAMRRAADRMRLLVADLLDTARIEAGHLSMDRVPVEVAPLLTELLEGMAALGERRSLHLVGDFPDELPPIYADKARLDQVFSNLVGNALKFTPDGGSVTIRAEPSEDGVKFSVTDRGPGIAAEDVPNLFARFWQGRATAGLGTGLGLFIVKGIVEAHGGRLGVETALGEGSTFSFTIPGVHAETTLSPATPAPAPLAQVLRAQMLQRAQDPARELPRPRLRPVTDSSRVARELAGRANEFRTDFMSVVSHELRGPLTVLDLLIERLQRDRANPLTSRQESITRKMLATVVRLTGIVESLLQHDLIRSGRLTTQIEVFDVGPVATDVVADLRTWAEGKELELRLIVTPNLPPIRSDPVLVRMVLLNLVGNAIKFTERGLVKVSVDYGDGAHRLMVKDSGPGIPVNDQVRIFDPFVKMDDAKQSHAPGMGVGLTLVREVLSALGGRVDLDSQVGRGSTFTVSLPSMSPAAVAEVVPLH